MNNVNTTVLEGLKPDQVYLEFRDRVYRYVSSRTPTHEDAEDLLSCVFLEVTRMAGTYDSGKASLSTWIYAITRNIVNEHLRRQYRRAPCVQFDDNLGDVAGDEPDVVDRLIDTEQLDELVKALKMLPSRERDIIVLRFYYNKSGKEVAALMRLSHENVRYLQNKAVKRLRELMSH